MVTLLDTLKTDPRGPRHPEKAGRPVRDWQYLPPAADFPSLSGEPPLKTLILQL